MGNFLFLAMMLAAVTLASWVAWRAGHDSAQRDAYFTISELRRGLRAENLEVARLREHNRMLSDRLDRARIVQPEAPEWMRP